MREYISFVIDYFQIDYDQLIKQSNNVVAPNVGSREYDTYLYLTIVRRETVSMNTITAASIR